MKKFIILMVLFISANLFAQVPLFSPRQVNGSASVEWASTGNDTLRTVQYFWYPNQVTFTGACTLAGLMTIDDANTDTLTTITARLIMAVKTVNNTVVYDSTAAHDLTDQLPSRSYLPIEDATTTSGTSFAVDLAKYNWWKPSIGIELTFYHSPKATMTKRIEAFLLPINYEK